MSKEYNDILEFLLKERMRQEDWDKVKRKHINGNDSVNHCGRFAYYRKNGIYYCGRINDSITDGYEIVCHRQLHDAIKFLHTGVK